MSIWVLLFLFVWVYDFVSTAIGLRLPGMEEGNFIIKPMINVGYWQGIFFLFLFKALIAYILILINSTNLFIIGTVFVGLVCLSNTLEIIRNVARRRN